MNSITTLPRKLGVPTMKTLQVQTMSFNLRLTEICASIAGSYMCFVAKKLKGVARAQMALLEETRQILRGKDSLVELIIDRNDHPSTMRLLAWRSLVATAVYLSEKNLPYTSGI